MEVDSEAPHHHRQFMDLLRAELEGGGDVSRGLRTILAQLVEPAEGYCLLEYADTPTGRGWKSRLQAALATAKEAL